ncbi:MAG: ribosome biogenesis/translation initiation ATPase RLI [Thaumarchaeota archaeon]|nr:ribosome biogenesis/translation initiation ATPase RLI [Nitrososphaerota archaeon]|tara:strand:+ start:171 stop:1979 length:1809 start_codon:yes stop_codon:yes gene_type:complete
MDLPVISNSHRIAALDKDNCLSKKCHLECINFCPVNKSGSECIILDSDEKALISESLCNGCGICVNKCPFDAITIVNMAHEIGDEKIHQYGVNSFRLYRLPIPIPGKVVGLVGKNGVGKTTALNILSGNLKPNLGSYEKDVSWDDILSNFQGTELITHFKKIINNELTVSIKPQAVYKLKDYWKSDGLSLLQSIPNNNFSNDIIEELNLSTCINKPVKDLSGGELQRLSIAFAAIKEADVYFFDEPSSYNDVFQRLAVSNTIRKLSDKGKSVILIEHDITFLDYLSDYIHILYGEAGAYGIVSSSSSTRTGINNLIDGYLPNENIKFRNTKIEFNVYSPSELNSETQSIIEYDDFTKTYDNFILNVSSGKILEGQVLGIIGGNALGKTTFMKILSGIEKADKDNIETKIKISYKPQYLDSNYSDNVRNLLYTQGSQIDDEVFNNEIIRPLSINKIFEKNVNTLSGGELQKVAIAICLMKDADIYALDEPSAFIDVEDRMVLARSVQKFIKSNNKSAIIIDHDIQLIDILSDSLLLFDGNNGINGIANEPTNKFDSMNKFLQQLQITYRRDIESGRPRVNKYDSRLDKEQKSNNQYYYLSKAE